MKPPKKGQVYEKRCLSVSLSRSGTPIPKSLFVSGEKGNNAVNQKRVKGTTGKCQGSDFPDTTPGNRKRKATFLSDFFVTRGSRWRICKGKIPCTSYSRTFTIHNYGYGTAYTFTHNNITLEHTAMNDKNTITHTDAYNTQF